METVFDHNITEQEWVSYFGYSKNEYLSNVTSSKAISDIALLYLLRCDSFKADQYISILDPYIKEALYRIYSHVVPMDTRKVPTKA